MRLFCTRAVVAAALTVGGCSLVGGCSAASDHLPASPVPAPLSDRQAITLASDYLDRHNMDERHVCSVEPSGDGNLVTVRSGFDAAAKPPVQSRLVLVKHTGAVREITFPRD